MKKLFFILSILIVLALSLSLYAKKVEGMFGIKLGSVPDESMNYSDLEYDKWLSNKKNVVGNRCKEN